jgi:hypothetical protein
MPRPIAVTVIAAFLFLATLIAGVVALSLLFPNPLLDRLWELNKPGAALFHSLGRISGVFLLALGCGTFAAACGMLQEHRWSWRFAVVLFTMNGIGDLISYFIVHDALRAITGILVSSAFIVLLCRPEVRAYFFRSELYPNHSA